MPFLDTTIEIIGPQDVSGVCTPQVEATPAPTEELYRALQSAYDHFNARLFDGRLPSCLITLQRKARTLGYYSPCKFAAMQGDARVDELALNPAHFRERPAIDICSTLVHEMVHLAQQHFGKPSRGGYHDRQWAMMMNVIGLHPSRTGAPGGAEVGYKMDHFIVPGGPFALAYEEFERTGATIGWGDAVNPNNNKPAKPKRLKFICPGCAANVHGIPSTRVTCTPCALEMVA